jgi:hypothetical protein
VALQGFGERRLNWSVVIVVLRGRGLVMLAIVF